MRPTNEEIDAREKKLNEAELAMRTTWPVPAGFRRCTKCGYLFDLVKDEALCPDCRH
jgi:predicted Zn-ribbon and HTH transcriptional regulator